MFQIVVVLLLFLVLVVPVGRYLYCVGNFVPVWGSGVFDKLDNFIYKLCGINKSDMTWKKYFFTFLSTNFIMMLLGFLILKLQSILFLNPNGAKAMTSSLAFNTVISFMTNTNLQHYAGESQISYLSQLVVITFMMFTSAASGYAVFMAFVRGITGKAEANSLGNFYVDMVRVITRVLLPASLILGLVLVSQGVPQNFAQNITVKTIDGNFQDIAMGPIASLEIIKHLGTNGGGFMSANSSSPLENPTAITNIIEMLSMMILPASSVYVFGKMASDRLEKGKSKNSWKFGSEGVVIFVVMAIIFIVGLSICYSSESAGNPILSKAGYNQVLGNMEGKEMRFGISGSSLFTSVTTAFTTGSVNNMHDSLTPMGGFVPLLFMMLNVVFGGKGVGLMNMVVYAILAVFICGLMIGRTPEYLGKKIEGNEMKLAAINIIIHPLLILTFSALALSVSSGIAGITNSGFHGLSQVAYEFASSAANNGSGFEGLIDNTTFWNISTAVVMFLGRYLSVYIQLALAGSLLQKNFVNETIGTLKTNTPTFTIALFVVVIIFSALTFLPILALGPIAESLSL